MIFFENIKKSLENALSFVSGNTELIGTWEGRETDPETGTQLRSAMSAVLYVNDVDLYPPNSLTRAVFEEVDGPYYDGHMSIAEWNKEKGV